MADKLEEICKRVKTIEGIMIFFFWLTVVSLIVGGIYWLTVLF